MGIAVVVLFAACGESNNSITKSEEQAGEGGVAFTFKSSQFKAAEPYPEPTNVRVFVRRYEGSNLKFNALVDVNVPTDTTVIVSVPANTGYQIDAISYIADLYNFKPILKFDQVTGVSVVPDSINNIALTLEPITATFTVPDTVEKGDNFSIGANFGNFMSSSTADYQTKILSYLRVDSTYTQGVTNANSDYYDGYSYGNEVNLLWDNVSVTEFEGSYAYYQIVHKLSADVFYRSDESNFSFIYNYPNPYVDDTLKTFIKIPEGGIGVTVTY